MVKDGQTLADIAIQEYGSLAAALPLARANGMSVTETPPAGRMLKLPDTVYDRTMEDWCKRNRVSPATQRDTSGIRLRVFGKEFTEEFE